MSSPTVKLYRPQLTDLDELVALDQTCLGGLWSKNGYQRELQSPNSHFWVLSCDLTQTIIGCGCFWEILEEAHITLLMVAPPYQGQGLGQLLLYGLLQDAVRRHLQRATLEVRVSNQPALSLYEKFGFQVAGQRKGYYKSTGEDALVLWRSGLQSPQFQQELSILNVARGLPLPDGRRLTVRVSSGNKTLALFSPLVIHKEDKMSIHRLKSDRNN